MIKISDSELEIMQIIWEKGEITSTKIIEELKTKKWDRNTIRTFITRLIGKKAVGISKKDGKRYTYVALINKKDYAIQKTKYFIDKLFNGSILDFLKYWIDNNPEYIEEIRETIKEIIEKEGG